MKRLQSRRNPSFKKILKMHARPEKFAPHNECLSGEVVVEGVRGVTAAVRKKTPIQFVLVAEDMLKDRRCEVLLGTFSDRSIPVYVVEPGAMKNLSHVKNPQGIVAVCSVQVHDMEHVELNEGEIIVVSDGLQDPGNMGTLLRICDAAGLEYVFSLKGSVNPFNPKAIRASAGSLFNVKIVFAERVDFVQWCTRKDILIVTTEVDAGVTVFEFTPSGTMSLIFGNESEGVSEEIRKAASESISVPIYGKAQSLNVASAASIAIYDLARRKRQPGTSRA